MDGWMDGWIYAYMHICIDEHMHICICEFMYGWMFGRFDVWMYGCACVCVCMLLGPRSMAYELSMFKKCRCAFRYLLAPSSSVMGIILKAEYPTVPSR